MTAPRTVPAERTVLAWSRTAATYGVVSLLLLRLAADSLPLVLAVAGLAAAGTGTVGLVTRSRWRLARTAALARRSVAPAGPAATLTAMVTLLGLAAAMLVVVH